MDAPHSSSFCQTRTYLYLFLGETACPRVKNLFSSPKYKVLLYLELSRREHCQWSSFIPNKTNKRACYVWESCSGASGYCQAFVLEEESEAGEAAGARSLEGVDEALPAPNWSRRPLKPFMMKMSQNWIGTEEAPPFNVLSCSLDGRW